MKRGGGCFGAGRQPSGSSFALSLSPATHVFQPGRHIAGRGSSSHGGGGGGGRVAAGGAGHAGGRRAGTEGRGGGGEGGASDAGGGRGGGERVFFLVVVCERHGPWSATGAQAGRPPHPPHGAREESVQRVEKKVSPPTHPPTHRPGGVEKRARAESALAHPLLSSALFGPLTLLLPAPVPPRGGPASTRLPLPLQRCMPGPGSGPSAPHTSVQTHTRPPPPFALSPLYLFCPHRARPATRTAPMAMWGGRGGAGVVLNRGS